MGFAPIGTLYLIGNVTFDNKYEHTIDFSSLTEQQAYFQDKIDSRLGENNDYQYIRQDQSVKVSKNIEDLFGINYIMYKNKTKWIYAFVTQKAYVSDSVTVLDIETDVMQTFMFDYAWNETFIEREHQDRWYTIGEPIYNVIPENLVLGEEYIKQNEDVIAASEKNFLVITSQAVENSPSDPVMIQNYPTPFHYYIIPYTAPEGQMCSQQLCRMLANDPRVIGISYIPFLPFPISGTDLIDYTIEGTSETLLIRKIKYNIQGTIDNLGSIAKFNGTDLPTSFGVGNLKSSKYESKLLTYPYMYNMLTDLQTKPLILKNEYLTGDTIIIGSTQGLSTQIKSKYYVSSGYKGENSGKLNNIVNSNVNDLPLVTDEYKAYMQNHKASVVTGLAINAVETAGAIGIAAATGGLGLAFVGNKLMDSAAGIAQELAKQKDLQDMPDSIRSLGNNISFDLADHNVYLMLYRYTIPEQIQVILGDYFAKYGYKCSEVKVPNLRSRYYYNYVKCIGCNIDGVMDNVYSDKIKDIFNTGVTIWHNRPGVIPLSYIYDNVEMSLI